MKPSILKKYSNGYEIRTHNSRMRVVNKGDNKVNIQFTRLQPKEINSITSFCTTDIKRGRISEVQFSLSKEGLENLHNLIGEILHDLKWNTLNMNEF